MSLLTLPPFRFRRKETAMPETAAPTKTEPNILMRFLTQGGATVVVTGSGRYVEDNGWRCLGCGGSDNGVGWGLGRVRDQANAHAKDCQSMPKPGA
ncbi:hypothetical protein [Streptomyces sp. NPDC059786]|uniref:hypothetical protein n=1 Tax=Streptomyces sp. NPDC059786 TaxID=3346946 RepID=UPI0036583E91